MRTLLKSGLIKHLKSQHTNPEDIKWFKCEYCLYKAKHKGDVKKHTISKHTNPEESNTERSSPKSHFS
ncbi:hypothetical protein BDFB_007796 [Asbolus verrucosus]|uniref:C2H2-type domain-containing protein n=1 Tax=Asbolus verrucosus TaxID=1661398 RepID=A0A482VEX6_ASBVE|nr:hypothetical protein BDFB_007796 [Asbolus verrucosus]